MTPPFASQAEPDLALLPDDGPRPGVKYTLSPEQLAELGTPEEIALMMEGPSESFDPDDLGARLEALYEDRIAAE